MPATTSSKNTLQHLHHTLLHSKLLSVFLRFVSYKTFSFVFRRWNLYTGTHALFVSFIKGARLSNMDRKYWYFGQFLLFLLSFSTLHGTGGSALLVAHAANTGSSSSSKSSSTSSWFSDAFRLATNKFNKLKAKVLGKKICQYRKYPAKYVKQRLEDFLRCQDTAVNSINSAIRAWDFELKNKNERHTGKPLVLAFTGPTGTGKTETSNLIAEALLQNREEIQNSPRRTPVGLLKFNGGNFNDATDPKSLSKYHDIIRTRLAQHLQECGGKAVVLFDEVQKVIPGTLDILKSVLSDRPQLDVVDPVTKKTSTVHCDNAVFIFVSDIGANEIKEVVVKHNGRENVPEAELNQVVRSAMHEQWKRLHFEGLIDMIIPFLPFENKEIQEILRLKVDELAKEHHGGFWDTLQVQDDVVKYLSTKKYIKYRGVTHRPRGQEGKPYNRSWPTKQFAKYGARNVVNGGPLQLLKAKFRKHLDYYDEDDNTNHVVVSMIPNNGKDISNHGKKKTNQMGIYVCTEKVNIDCFDGNNSSNNGGKDSSKTCKNVCKLAWQGSLEPLGS